MVCEAVRSVIRQFMDDLLDEKDYQEICAHLGSCQRCHKFASSVGTLSYRLYELGQISLPPDIVSAILYELKKVPAKVEADPVFPQFSEVSPGGAFSAQTRPFWIAVFVLATISIAATTSAFFWRFQAAPGFVPTVVLPPERLGERHFHLALSARPELAELIIELQLAVERDSERSLVFLVPVQKSSQFQESLESLSVEVREFGESESKEDMKDERITVFFE